ncbi:MAG: ferredoxin, partial [Myxococcaceae bacterium]|nr:ferredoxin [Myxococcaceae bacterium]
MAARVVIAGTGQAFDAELEDDILEVLQRNGYPISTSCGGIASCGLCRITVLEGKDNLTPIKPAELGHLGNVAKVIGLRLACQSKVVVEGDIVVRVPDVEDVEEKKRKKADRLRAERRPMRGPKVAPAHAGSPSEDSPPSSRHVSRAPRADLIEWRPRVLQSTPDTSASNTSHAKADEP